MTLPTPQEKSLYLQSMVKSYLETAIWVTYDAIDDITTNDIHLDSKLTAIKDCGAFLDKLDFKVKKIDSNQMGHDFFLTRNNHGAGFWDRGNGQFGDELTTLSQSFKSFDVVIGDDKKVHFE